MAWQSPYETFVQQMMIALPGISRQTAGALSHACMRAFDVYAGRPFPTISDGLEWIRTRSDTDLLCIRNFGIVSLESVRFAQTVNEYALAGPCNWVGEGVPA